MSEVKQNWVTILPELPSSLNSGIMRGYYSMVTMKINFALMLQIAVIHYLDQAIYTLDIYIYIHGKFPSRERIQQYLLP